jgi:hypothetical protein
MRMRMRMRKRQRLRKKMMLKRKKGRWQRAALKVGLLMMLCSLRGLM